MGKQNKKKSKIISVFSAVALFLVGVIVGAIANVYGILPDGYEIPATKTPSSSPVTGEGYSVQTVKEKELSIHFLELGNKYTGDCTLIDVGEV
ncbi:MAG: hypothetical protein IJY26_03450 [Clostridia bacterium]|nr:hypothetical protein [Clostridia bacterium]